ncbi:MAG: LysM peptidoglycan-binding domain-containing M23 family metallopeptidase [Anaerolineae bacterium]|jgi:murein DD-endopeptidase MepM/ murein hydrolase activator NlpD
MKGRYRAILLLCLVLALVRPAWVSAQSGGPLQPLVHVVQRGETLFSIARRYGTTVEAIAHANGIPDPRQIYVGQRLLIPSGIEPSDTWSTHIVQPGETLSAIATQYALPWRTLAMANRLVNPNLLYAGQVLDLPGGASRAGALHAVQPGETLTAIAYHHGLSLWELIEANHIANPSLILPGQWLLVPGEQPAWMPLPFTSVDLSPLPARQGQTVFVTVQAAEPVTLTGELFDRPLTFVEENDAYHAVVGIHAFTEPGLYELRLTAIDSEGQPVTISMGMVVEEGGYSYERIDIPRDRTNLLDPDLVAAERERIDEVRTIVSAVRRWQGPFRQPVEAAISSRFGTRRSYNGGPYSSYHAGVDFNAGRGTPVRAPASGAVVLAESLAVRGNAIVLDHGWGVLTGYWHLSSIEVAVGQEVQTGEVIGRVGSTGLSTGAHLHWEVWAGGISVDGLQWLSSAPPSTALDDGASIP